MSLLLSALRRAAQQRQSDAVVPRIDSPAPAGGQGSPPRHRAAALAALVVAVAITVAALMWSPTVAPPTAVPAVSPSPSLVATPVVVPEPAPAIPAVELRAPQPARTQPDPNVRALYAALSAADSATPAVDQAPDPGAAGQLPAAIGGHDTAQGSAEPTAQQSEAAAARLDIDAVVAEAERGLSQPLRVEHPAPFLGELPQHRRDRIPSLRYQEHQFAPDAPTASRVQLNGALYQAGDSLGGGLLLREILADSIVLEHEGLQFRLRALNSWINL